MPLSRSKLAAMALTPLAAAVPVQQRGLQQPTHPASSLRRHHWLSRYPSIQAYSSLKTTSVRSYQSKSEDDESAVCLRPTSTRLLITRYVMWAPRAVPAPKSDVNLSTTATWPQWRSGNETVLLQKIVSKSSAALQQSALHQSPPSPPSTTRRHSQSSNPRCIAVNHNPNLDLSTPKPYHL